MADTQAEKPEVRLRRKAMDFLARREHSFTELQQKIAGSFPDDDENLILSVLEQLRSENLQSDARFAESYVRSRGFKGHGPLKIAAELQHKGIDAGLVRTELYGGDYDWYEQGRRALLKKFGDNVPADSRAQQRYYRFLAQRGFSGEHIRLAMKVDNSDN